MRILYSNTSCDIEPGCDRSIPKGLCRLFPILSPFAPLM